MESHRSTTHSICTVIRKWREDTGNRLENNIIRTLLFSKIAKIEVYVVLDTIFINIKLLAVASDHNYQYIQNFFSNRTEDTSQNQYFETSND